MSFLIGITGGIGTGKSSISRLLSSFCNKPLLDIDKCCRNLLHKNEPGWKVLYEHLGQKYFDNSGELNRPYLREKLFNESRLKEQVDELLHPLARKEMHKEVEKYQDDLVFAEIPLLYEAGWEKDVERVIVVTAHADMQYQRIIERDKVSMEQAVLSVASQLDLKIKAGKADYVIDNNGAWCLTRLNVINVAEQLEKTVVC